MAKPYRLYITETSPFARKARIVARERGVADRVEETTAAVRTDANEVLAHSPLGKVPTLIGPDGFVLTDSSAIAAYFDSLDGQATLCAADGPDRWRRLEARAFAEGLLESLAWRTREFRRPEHERSPAFIAYEGARQARAYDWLEAHPPVKGPRDVADVTLAIALDYALYRFPDEDWRPGRPEIAAWFDTEAARPAFLATSLPPKL